MSELLTKPRGDWMQTFTGRAFFPLEPRAEDVDIRDIAHALSLLCRYNGHIRRFYSVAEHCVLMSTAVVPEHALWALLHDATEAYMGDMIRPLKRQMPEYAAAEDRLMAVLCERFGLPLECPAEVKDADTRILRNERELLLGPSPLPWLSVEEVEPLPVQVRAWAPATAEAAYLGRFGVLTGSLAGLVEEVDEDGTEDLPDCARCAGSGYEPGTHEELCRRCAGSGYEPEGRRRG